MLQYDIDFPENVEYILSQDLWVSDQFSTSSSVTSAAGSTSTVSAE